MKIQTKDAIIIAGRVSGEIKSFDTSKGTKGYSFGVMTRGRQAEDGQAEFTNCKTFRSIGAAHKKGDDVLDAGKLETRTNAGKDGAEKSVTEVIAEFIAVQGNASESAYVAPQTPKKKTTADLTPLDDDNLPF